MAGMMMRGWLNERVAEPVNAGNSWVIKTQAMRRDPALAKSVNGLDRCTTPKSRNY